MLNNRPDHRQLAKDIHQSNVDAGWWTDLTTGQPLNRNFGEMLALVHSELSECWEGLVYKCMDNHLPHIPMWKVEIADACIRVYDMVGGCLIALPEYIEFTFDFPDGWLNDSTRLVALHKLLSDALEHYRKSRPMECKMFLYRFLDACFEWAEQEQFDLMPILLEKWEYNKSRADHKIENRLKEDGKKI